MEQVLDIYKQPYNPKRPVVCMDESSKQLIKEIKTPLGRRPGNDAKYDYEYERNGVCNIFVANEPLTGKRIVEITKQRTKKDWAKFIQKVAKRYQTAEKIILVMDNLNTHCPSSLYEAFDPAIAKKLWDRFEFVYTPKHGSWLNMAEIELRILNGQCLNRRIPNLSKIKSEVKAWTKMRNSEKAKINWQFTTEDSRVKLKKLYPTLDS